MTYSSDKTELAEKLCALLAQDLSVRQDLLKRGVLNEGYHPEMEAVHRQNAAALEAIMDEHGWPTAEMVGEKAAEAAWVIAQHAIGQPDFFRRCFEEVKKAAEQGKAPLSRVAMMTDRICHFEGKPQIYGTNFNWDEKGRIQPSPIADPERVDERRAKVGLPPLAEAMRKQEQGIKEEGMKPPSDWKARERGFQDWVRKTGWRKG